MALSELEQYTQARIGNVHAPETTGKFVAATFEHDTARPVDGYAAPQLHTHSVIFNVTERENGQTRALQPQELYASQRYATGIYRAELATRLQELGYEIERGKYGQPEIKGYPASIWKRRACAESRSKTISASRDWMEREPRRSRRITRATEKELLSPEEVQRQHRELAASFGHQADHVVAAARERSQEHQQERSPEIDCASGRDLRARSSVREVRCTGSPRSL